MPGVVVTSPVALPVISVLLLVCDVIESDDILAMAAGGTVVIFPISGLPSDVTFDDPCDVTDELLDEGVV